MNRETVYILVTVAAMIISFMTGWLSNRKKIVGNFVINHVDPTKDMCTLELISDIDNIESMKTMTLCVKVIK